MAVTVTHPTPTDEDVFGRHYVTFLDVAFDGSQADDGEALDLRPYDPHGSRDPVFVGISPNAQAAEGYVVSYDYTNRLIQVFHQTDSDNAVPLGDAATVDLSAFSVRLFVVY